MKTKLFTLVVALICATQVFAHDFEVDGIYYNILGGDSVAVTYKGNSYNDYANEYSGAITIPTTIEHNSAFYRVTAIDKWTFNSCSQLTEVIIPDGVTSIGVTAFFDCYSLSKITLPNSITSISKGAFSGCSSLATITIPNSVTTIGDYAFNGCASLANITWNAKNCTSAPFADIASQILSFTLGNEVEIIPASLCRGMSGLSTITLYNKVASIGPSAFKDCTGLRKLTIGSGIEKMGNEAFAGCTGLLTLSIAADIPPLVQINTFQNVSTTAIIKVPCGASELYRAASYWNTFTNCQDGVLFAFSAISADDTKGCVTIIQKPICDNDAVAIFEAVPYNGYKFVSWNDGHTENPRTVDVIEDVEYIATFTVSDVTAVGNIVTEHLSGVQKVFENGTIYILRNSEKYAIDGRKVK